MWFNKTMMTKEEKKLRERIAWQIQGFDCPECEKLDRCIDSIKCRIYAQGRKDAVKIALGQVEHLTEIIPADEA